MPTLRDETFDIRTSADVVKVRQVARAWSAELGFSLVDQTKIVTGTSELARNTLEHGGGGRCRIEVVQEDDRRGLRLSFEDEGPGIPDLQLALTDGYTTGTGLGLGLSGARRLMSEFRLQSEVGKGTRVQIARWR